MSFYFPLYVYLFMIGHDVALGTFKTVKCEFDLSQL